jgi:hypothetical protein
VKVADPPGVRGSTTKWWHDLSFDYGEQYGMDEKTGFIEYITTVWPVRKQLYFKNVEEMRNWFVLQTTHDG